MADEPWTAKEVAQAGWGCVLFVLFGVLPGVLILAFVIYLVRSCAGAAFG